MILIHHHENNIVAYERASCCEKTIYYHSGHHSCGHREHISKPIEKCFLCDHHSTALFTFDFAIFSFFKDSFIPTFFDFHESKLVDFSILFFNKGPPSI